MKGVYAQNPQMGDPTSLEPQISETTHHIGHLRGELAKYEVRAQSVALHLLISRKLFIWVRINLTSCFVPDMAIGSSWRRGICQRHQQ